MLVLSLDHLKIVTAIFHDRKNGLVWMAVDPRSPEGEATNRLSLALDGGDNKIAEIGESGILGIKALMTAITGYYFELTEENVLTGVATYRRSEKPYMPPEPS